MSTEFSILLCDNYYGVKVVKRKDSNRIKLEKSVFNLSTDIAVAERFVNLCNKLNVDYEHFEDVLENFLTDFETL